MKTVTLRKSLSEARLTSTLRQFINKNKNKNFILIDKIVLILRNNQEFKLLDNIILDTNNQPQINTVLKLTVKNFKDVKLQNPDIDISKESEYIMFFYN